MAGMTSDPIEPTTSVEPVIRLKQNSHICAVVPLRAVEGWIESPEGELLLITAAGGRFKGFPVCNCEMASLRRAFDGNYCVSILLPPLLAGSNEEMERQSAAGVRSVLRVRRTAVLGAKSAPPYSAVLLPDGDEMWPTCMPLTEVCAALGWPALGGETNV